MWPQSVLHVWVLIVASHLLDVVTSTDIYDDVFRIAKLPGNVQ